ncbi:hypothetical protein CALCODRAFT_293401 [Calocera cornea HHB12733]|uniref:Secreted protein n=1 Tax=Calocera cornea HHB12733 TaxID=1353952 RepID=A0A165FR73_9BASI|nr:hypothetical protein CALCODRAFT_293401 [Calocera cornea HHB12733]
MMLTLTLPLTLTLSLTSPGAAISASSSQAGPLGRCCSLIITQPFIRVSTQLSLPPAAVSAARPVTPRSKLIRSKPRPSSTSVSMYNPRRSRLSSAHIAPLLHDTSCEYVQFTHRSAREPDTARACRRAVGPAVKLRRETFPDTHQGGGSPSRRDRARQKGGSLARISISISISSSPSLFERNVSQCLSQPCQSLVHRTMSRARTTVTGQREAPRP